MILKETMLKRLLKIMYVIINNNYNSDDILDTCAYIFVQEQKIEGLDVSRVTDVLMVCQNYMKDKDVSF